MAYDVWLDGYETLSETQAMSGVRRAVMDGLKEVFDFSDMQCMHCTEGDFPKILAVGLSREQASVAVRRLRMFGAYVRQVDTSAVETAWDKLMRS